MRRFVAAKHELDVRVPANAIRPSHKRTMHAYRRPGSFRFEPSLVVPRLPELVDHFRNPFGTGAAGPLGFIIVLTMPASCFHESDVTLCDVSASRINSPSCIASGERPCPAGSEGGVL